MHQVSARNTCPCTRCATPAYAPGECTQHLPMHQVSARNTCSCTRWVHATHAHAPGECTLHLPMHQVSARNTCLVVTAWLLCHEQHLPYCDGMAVMSRATPALLWRHGCHVTSNACRIVTARLSCREQRLPYCDCKVVMSRATPALLWRQGCHVTSSACLIVTAWLSCHEQRLLRLFFEFDVYADLFFVSCSRLVVKVVSPPTVVCRLPRYLPLHCRPLSLSSHPTPLPTPATGQSQLHMH